MAFDGFPKKTLKFLNDIERNNKKEWFDAHRDDYERYYKEVAREFVEAMVERLPSLSGALTGEAKINRSIRRINRDIRFSPDKRPYKNHLDFHFWAGRYRNRRVTLFLRLYVKSLVLAAGRYKLDKTELEAYRQAVADNRTGRELLRIVRKMRRAGYEIGGRHYKRGAQGFRRGRRAGGATAT